MNGKQYYYFSSWIDKKIHNKNEGIFSRNILEEN